MKWIVITGLLCTGRDNKVHGNGICGHCKENLEGKWGQKPSFLIFSPLSFAIPLYKRFLATIYLRTFHSLKLYFALFVCDCYLKGFVHSFESASRKKNGLFSLSFSSLVLIHSKPLKPSTLGNAKSVAF